MNSETLKLFYALKPLFPRRSQLLLRQIRAKRIFEQIEPPYLEGLDSSACIYTPEGYNCIVLLTHDVETAEGLKKIELIREIEREYDVPSTWNFVLKKYGSPENYIDRLRDEDCECGAHGLYHDGKLFKDYDTYQSRMEEIVSISEKLGLQGFRSPALHRNAEWMQDLPFKWDSSFPAWDPFQPQPGGCKKYAPYKLNNVTLEFPITLWQDFTLFYELGLKDSSVWEKQAKGIYKQKGLVNIIVHPDYMTNKNLVRSYSNFLGLLRSFPDIYVTTPSSIVSYSKVERKQHE